MASVRISRPLETIATAGTTEPVRPGPRLLISEDHLQTRMLLQSLLKQHGYRTTVTTNGNEAWDELLKTVHDNQENEGQSYLSGEDTYDLLLCDWNMPELDGLQLVQKIREHKGLKSLYIIMLTAHNKTDELVAALEGGADDYVVKPFQVGELMARIKAGTRIRQLQRDLAGLQHQVAALHLATGASHEINNPLMALMGNWELLTRRIKDCGDPKIIRHVEVIGEAAQRIKQVSDRLRSLKTVRLVQYVRGTQMVDLGGPPMEPEGPIRPGETE